MARTEMPTSVEALQELVIQQQALLDQNAAVIEVNQSTITEQAALISFYREWKRLMDSQRFGSRSERLVPEQGRLFNEAESLATQEEDDENDAITVPSHTRKKRGRRPLPDFLPVHEILHDLSEDEKVCAHDASHTLVEISRETSDQLKFIPATVEILRHVRPKYACPTCKEGVKIAPMPKLPIPKSIATPSLLAHVATSKYVDGLPLYRQEKIFQRLGVDVSRATLASWMVKMGDLVEPLMDRIRDEIRAGSFVQCDETPFQVLKEPGKRAQSQSYLWVLRAGEPDHPLVYYEYDPSRSSEVPKRLLRGFKGFMQTDGYKGYDALGKLPGIVHVGCFAHARRKFDEALRGQGKSRKSKSSPKESVARQGLKRINKLYELERLWRGASPDERYAFRQEKTKPKLEQLKQWLTASKERVPPTSLTGEALAYLESQWPKLERVLDDGRISLDTNAVERCIRPFVIGRRNWLFADTPKGATASARLYSLVETAKANGLEPWTYLATIFEKLPAAASAAEIEALLPGRIEMGDLRTATRLPHPPHASSG